MRIMPPKPDNSLGSRHQHLRGDEWDAAAPGEARLQGTKSRLPEDDPSEVWGYVPKNNAHNAQGLPRSAPAPPRHQSNMRIHSRLQGD